ncbi:MAG: hypothetical protein JOZ19_15575 [Rubrobacter sp.]|nr:hypothetical protein [Rubrobacter sp.]
MNGASGRRCLEPQVLACTITLDETMISESDIMGNNTSFGEEAFVDSLPSENEELESQMSGQPPLICWEGLAAVAAD